MPRQRIRQATVPNGTLIADESGIFRKAVRNYLTRRNFEVCGEAIDGNDVLEKATEPNLILRDSPDSLTCRRLASTR